MTAVASLETHSSYRRLYKHRGVAYREVLGAAHRFLRPRSYLEIGVNTGMTLALADCRSLGIDPRFQFATELGRTQERHISEVIGKKERLMLFQQTSDDFFASNDVAALAGGPVSLAFLDGLHEAEFLLRDFFNTERVSGRASVIFMHDCLPTDIWMARRGQMDEIRHQSPKPGLWSGDVWKALHVIRKHRPDLKITCLDAGPTGLVAITGLDPSSDVLPNAYDDLEAEMAALETTHESLAQFLADCKIVSTSEVASEAGMRKTFELPAA